VLPPQPAMLNIAAMTGTKRQLTQRILLPSTRSRVPARSILT
jgi:hypothetical protein